MTTTKKQQTYRAAVGPGAACDSQAAPTLP